MAQVIGVRFKDVGKIYYFDPLDLEIIKGSRVIVETARGVECGLSAEPGFPDRKGEKALYAENCCGNAAQFAGIGLFQHGEKRGKDGIQKSLHRKIPSHSIQAEPETAGRDPCLQQENAYRKRGRAADQGTEKRTENLHARTRQACRREQIHHSAV